MQRGCSIIAGRPFHNIGYVATNDLKVHVLVMMSDAKVMPDEDGEKAEPVPCFNCDANCWKAGWLLLAGEEGEDRKNLCDNCFLFTPKPKGAERRFQGKIKIVPIVPKKEKRKVVKKKPAAVKRTRK
jgi:hypothetical protein